MLAVLLLSIFLILPIMVSLGAMTDIYGYTIPNVFSLILIIGFYSFAILNPIFSWEMIAYHSLAGFIVLAVTFVLFSFGFLGGGDAKIMAASSLWFGLGDVGHYIVLIVIAGGVLSLLFMIWRRTKPFEIYNKFTPLRNLFHGPECQQDKPMKKRSIPYAIAIAIGFYITLPSSTLFMNSFM